MTQRRQRETDPQPDPADPTPDELEAFDEVQRLISEAGPGAAVRVIVFKKRPDGKLDRCRTFTSAELENMDVIPEKLGGGEYVLRLMDQANKYMKQLQVSWPVELYPPPRPVAPPAAVVPGAPATPAVDQFAQVVLLMQQESQRSQERYTALLQSIVTSLIGSSRPTSMKDRLEEMTLFKGLLSQNPTTPIDLVKDMVTTGMNLARGKTGEGDDEGSGEWVGLVNRGLDVIDKAITNRGPAGPRAVPAAAGRTAATVPDNLKPYLWLMKYVPAAIGWAKSGTPVNRAAQAVYALVPEDHLDVLETFARMNPAERGQVLVGLDSRLGPYQAYMDELAGQLVAIFEAEDSGGGDDAGDVPGASESA